MPDVDAVAAAAAAVTEATSAAGAALGVNTAAEARRRAGDRGGDRGGSAPPLAVVVVDVVVADAAAPLTEYAAPSTNGCGGGDAPTVGDDDDTAEADSAGDEAVAPCCCCEARRAALHRPVVGPNDGLLLTVVGVATAASAGLLAGWSGGDAATAAGDAADADDAVNDLLSCEARRLVVAAVAVASPCSGRSGGDDADAPLGVCARPNEDGDGDAAVAPLRRRGALLSACRAGDEAALPWGKSHRRGLGSRCCRRTERVRFV